MILAGAAADTPQAKVARPCPLQRYNIGGAEMMRSAVVAGALAAGALLALASSDAQTQSKKWYPFAVEEHNPPFDMASPVKEVMYSPLEKADKKWSICVSFPHMKDAYWLAVDYGVSEEAKDLGVAMHRRGWRLHQPQQTNLGNRGLRIRRPGRRYRRDLL